MREFYFAYTLNQIENNLLPMVIIGIGAGVVYQFINMWPQKLQPWARAGAVVGSVFIYVFTLVSFALELEQNFGVSRYLGW